MDFLEIKSKYKCYTQKDLNFLLFYKMKIYFFKLFFAKFGLILNGNNFIWDKPISIFEMGNEKPTKGLL